MADRPYRADGDRGDTETAREQIRAVRQGGNRPMDALTLAGIALGLAMDAFAVAIATGIVLGTVSPRPTFRLAWHLGLFQFLMPVVGWMAGLSVERFLSAYDHWLAFGLLAGLGGKMIYEALKGGGGGGGGGGPSGKRAW